MHAFKALALAAVLLEAASPSAAEPPLPFTLVEVGSGVFAALDGPEHRSGSNAGFVIGDDGVLVIDSFFNPQAAQALVAEIRRRTDKPIRYVVNTHYHLDHTAGDAVLKAAGAIVIAHANVRGWLKTENLHLLGAAITPARRALLDGLVSPDLTTRAALTVWLGSRRVEVRPVEGHTGGDLVISVPDAGTLFCGDLFWRQIPPNTIDGRLGAWTATLGDFEALPGAAEMRFVPGHGAVGGVADVAAARAYLQTLRSEVAAARTDGLSGEALAARVLGRLKPAYGAWQGFAGMAPREIREAEAEARGDKRLPIPAS